MMNELWESFPRLLEHNVNSLLDTAEPNPVKAFQLYKTCKNDDLWHENFASFSNALREFYSKPRRARRKVHFDRLLDRPMDSHVFGAFHLNFRTAQIDDCSINDLASWAHNIIRISKKSMSTVFSVDVMKATLKAVVTPGPLGKAEYIEFDDICEKWKTVVGQTFGAEETRELNMLVTELRQMNSDHHELEEVSGLIAFPHLQITPVEVDWLKLVRLAALAHAKIPKPPVSTVLRKQTLRDLDRVIQLYELVLVTKLDELMKHRESTRLTLIDRCDTILGEAQALIA